MYTCPQVKPIMTEAHWFAFFILTGLGASTAHRLLERFGCIESAFAAPDAALFQLPRITPDLLARMRARPLAAIEADLAAWDRQGLHVVTWEDARYPAQLRLLSDAPPVLIVQGDLRTEDSAAVAIVGTRQPTPAGRATATWLARELAGRGLAIVSGLALGIDTAAHRGALAAAAGRTFAVPGAGLHTLHPRQNTALAYQISARGALISEVHPDTRVSPQVLMARNRIVGGLSRAVIVIEASGQGGSLPTAQRARRNGRLLFAVPGSPGADRLLAQGAEPLDPRAADLNALADRICQHCLPGRDAIPKNDLNDPQEGQLRLFGQP